MRDGVPRRPGARDSVWIAVTSVLEHATLIPDDAPILIGRAAEMARDALGEEFVQRRGDREWPSDRWPGDAILLLADDAHEGDAFQTSLAMLTALDRGNQDLLPVQRGRVLARRGRALSRLGRLDDARDQFRAVGRLGKDTSGVELRARAWLGLGSLAQMRGNYAELESLNRRALRLARRGGLSLIERYSRLGLMIAAATRHDFDVALVHGWAVYRTSVGPFEEGEILQSFGQLMVEARCFAEARAAFGAVVSRALPARIIIPALGGLAISAAESARPATVRWVANQLHALSATGVPRHPLSVSLLECSLALARIGQQAASDSFREQATALAQEHGFHEVAVRAAEMDGRDSAPPTHAFTLRGRSGRIAGEIASLEPGRLPDQVSLIAVPA